MVTLYFFFFNDTATTEIYTLSLHDALPIYREWSFTVVWSNDGWNYRDNLRDGFCRGCDRKLRRHGRYKRQRRRKHDDHRGDRKSTRLNSSHANISYAVFCLKKKTEKSIIYT